MFTAAPYYGNRATSILLRNVRVIFPRAKPNLQKKPTVPGKKMTIRSSGKQSNKNAATIDASTEDVVIHKNEKLDLAKYSSGIEEIERAQTLYSKQRYLAKRMELDRMEKAMAKAVIELENTSPDLFKKAMLRREDQLMPLERRFPVDTPARKT